MPSDRPRRRGLPDKSGRSPKRSDKVRVLFGATGWPCGLLEIASWAKREELAEVVVFHVQPGYAFRLQPVDRPYLAEGPVHPEIIDSFAMAGRPLSEDATVRRADRAAWEIHDPRRGWTYRVADRDEGLDVYVVENMQTPDLDAAVRRFAESESLSQELLDERGLPNDATREALAALGGPFVRKLIEFRPHVVGFRLEGGQFPRVKRSICAVRLFSGAEIVLGGPTATSHPAEVLQASGADYVFAGEAEEPFNLFLRLARERNSKDRQPEIPGLAYRYGGRVYVNTLPADGYERTALDLGPPLRAARLRAVRNAIRPLPGAGLIAANRLDWSLLEGFDRAELDSLFFTGGRGCPGACTFCAKLHGQEVRAKSARQLLAEIEAADAKVAEGAIRVTRWPLFQYVDDPQLRSKQAVWAAVYDEDFFLHRKRAIEFFRLWDRSPLKERYRLSLQTNPCSMLGADGRAHAELLAWIDRLKPMVQLGAESFHPDLLARWRKRHNVGQLNTVLEALDATGQDYTVFQLLTDFDTTPEELVETLRLLVLNAYQHRRMRIASSPLTIPLYDCETRRMLEHRGLLTPDRVRHFTDYERPQPGWMDPLVAELADLADAELRFALHLPQRDAALHAAFEAVLERIREESRRVERMPTPGDGQRLRILQLEAQAEHAMGQIQEARFQAVVGTRRVP